MATDLTYPADLFGVRDLGGRHFAVQLSTEGGEAFGWWHDCSVERTWSWIGSVGGSSSGHVITSVDPLTVVGFLFCPRGCGDHGLIDQGRWISDGRP